MSQQGQPDPDNDLINSWLAAAEGFGEFEETASASNPNDVFIDVPLPIEPVIPERAVDRTAAREEPGPLQTLSAQDRARLLSNRAIDANRWVRVGNKVFPILHLTLIDLESFQWITEEIKQFMSNYLLVFAAGTSFEEYAKKNRDLITLLLRDRVPVAAAMALGLTVEETKQLGSPLDLLGVVLEQWTHNFEIASLKELFPYPPEEEPEFTDEQLGITDDPNPHNPLAMFDGLCQAYHWSYESVANRTFPQIYLVGVSSAWKNYRTKREMDLKDEENKRHGGRSVNKKGPRVKAGKVFFEGKFWDLKDMDRATNARYINAMLSAPYQNVSN